MALFPADSLFAAASFRLSAVLPAQTQILDHRPVPLDVLLLQIREQAAPVPDHLEQTAARMVVFGVGLQVFGQDVDTLGEDAYLHLG